MPAALRFILQIRTCPSNLGNSRIKPEQNNVYSQATEMCIPERNFIKDHKYE